MRGRFAFLLSGFGWGILRLWQGRHVAGGGLCSLSYLEFLSMKHLLRVAGWAEPVLRARLEGNDGRPRWLCQLGGSS